MTKDKERQASRRDVLRGSLVVLAGNVVAASQAGAQTPTKIAQKVVQYQDTPKNNQKCSICVNYIDPDACKLVAGKINPDGWCILFGPKSA